MRIYTRTGDTGETDLVGGIRVRKDHARVNAYGEIDELNAHIGFLRAATEDAATDLMLTEIQTKLLEAGAELARPDGDEPRGRTVQEKDVRSLEAAIDRLQSVLPPLTNFVLPGGAPAACRAHIARSVCRRAERSVVRLLHAEPGKTDVLRYLNRLSDLLFVLSQWANHRAGGSETTWAGRQPTRDIGNPGEPDQAP